MFRNFLFSYLIRPRNVRGAGKLLYRFSTLANSSYSVWTIKKMCKRLIVLINDDEDVVAAITTANGNILYLHPRTRGGINILWKRQTEGGA